MKKILSILLIVLFGSIKAQVLFSDAYGMYTLQDYTTTTSTTTYSTVNTASYTILNDGLKNNVGSTNAPNKPFNVPALKTTGWAISYNAIENDTFLVSTSWLDTSAAVNRWIVTPLISTITASTVLSWEAMSPDPNYRDGYEVYVTNNTGTLTPSSFSISDRIFSISDGNTAGGGEQSTWTKHGISLAMYAGQNLRIAFRNTSKNMYQLWIDDVVLENVVNSTDAEITLTQPPINKYNKINTPANVSCHITNRGYNNINSITLNYMISGIANQLEAFSASVPVSMYGSKDFIFSVPYSISTPGYYKIKMWVSYVNGLVDQNHLNDTTSSFVSIMSSAPPKTVMVEQFTSAFDGYGPDGQDKLNALITPSVVVVNVHDGDSLKISSVSSLISTYRKTTTTACVDRNYFYDISSVPVDKSSYASKINQRLTAVVPASVSIINKVYTSSTRVLTFTVKADFIGEVKGDFRINACLTENNVYGPSGDATYNGWNQLSFMYNIPWSQYFQQGNFYGPANGYVIDAFRYKHQWVLDASLDGSFGLSGGPIPLTGGTQGQSYTKSYSYTVPAAPVSSADTFRYNADNMYIVGYVAEYSINKIYRTVLNCAQDKVTSNSELITVKELSVENNLFQLYPNPSYGAISILIPEKSFKNAPIIKVIDILGKEVYVQQTDFNFGLLQLNLNHLANGTYYIKLEDGNSSSLKKLIIAK